MGRRSAVRGERFEHGLAQRIADACGGMEIKRRALGIAEFSGRQAVGINTGVCIAVHL